MELGGFVKEMSWFPALDLAAQYWQGKRTLPRDYDVLDRLRRAISDLPPDSDLPMDKSEASSEVGSEISLEKHTWNVDEDRKLKKLAKTYDYDWEEVAARLPQHSPLACLKRWEKKQRRQAAAERKEEHWTGQEGSGKPLSQSTAEHTIAKDQQIELLRENASRLEEKIRLYKEELGRLEVDLDSSQL